MALQERAKANLRVLVVPNPALCPHSSLEEALETSAAHQPNSRDRDRILNRSVFAGKGEKCKST